VIVEASIAITLLIAAWQLFVFFWKNGERGSDSPIRIIINTAVAIFFIFMGNYIFEMIIEFCKYPYEAIDKIDAAKWGVSFELGWETIITDALQGMFGSTSMLFYLVMLFLICFNMAKLLLEIIERYVVAFVLLYLSPAAAATLASSSTNGIYKKYFMMFISQCVLIFLNSWCLRMACSGLSLSAHPDNQMIVPFLLCYGFLRVSTKMDSYLNQLGLNAAVTGNGLGAEIVGAGAALIGYGKGGSGGIGGASNGGTGGNVLGAVTGAQKWINRISPVHAMGGFAKDVVTSGVTGASEAYRSGRNLFTAQKNDDGKITGRSAVYEGFKAAGNTVKQSDNLISNVTASSKTRQAVVNGAAAVKAKLTGTSPETKTVPPGYRERLNNELIEGSNHEDENISAWSNNSHLAQAAFSHVQQQPEGNNTENGIVVDENARVAAVAKGLGFGSLSDEASSFIKAGFGQEDGAVNFTYALNNQGITMKYDTTDGYRHKAHIYDRGQYVRLTAQEREGLQQFRTPDGHRYYARMSKTKKDNPPKDDKKEKNNQNPQVSAAPDPTTEPNNSTN
jgi:hypothetical protein